MKMSSLMAVMISLKTTATQTLLAVQVAQIIRMGIFGQGNKLLWVAREEMVTIIMITMKKMKMMKAGVTKWKK